jgi:hypothetical protein
VATLKEDRIKVQILPKSKIEVTTTQKRKSMTNPDQISVIVPKKDQQTQQAQQQKRVFASDNSDIQLQALEYDSNDEQPEWSEFDPKINTGKFFGREMKDASEIRNKAQIIRKDKGLKKVEDEEDEFDRIMKEKK